MRKLRMPRLGARLYLPMLGLLMFERPALAGDLTIEDRVRAQAAIERVHWSHRIWPKENRTPKPPLEAVLGDDAIRAKVEDALRKSNALDRIWSRPITAEQLQAELNRMVADTRDPQMLEELFQALGNDPRLIAETLARQSLTERLIRSWYQGDERFHGVQRRRAVAALATCGTVACMPSMGGEYSETTWRLAHEPDPTRANRNRGVVSVDAGEWRQVLDRLARTLGGTRAALPLLEVSRLEETGEDFRVTALVRRTADDLSTATVIWPKEPFDVWWAKERESEPAGVETVSGRFSLPVIGSGGCADDTWTPADYVPDPREHPMAVWTGKEMIVWSGDNGSDNLDSGGRYDPLADTWRPTSTGANEPSGRTVGTAVWTGAEMIVWGGYDSAYRNTGGRYDPVTDTWTPTSTGVNVPTGRGHHAAVWTGQEMIVWGGFASGNRLNTGGRYNPATDTWMPTSTATGVPEARNDFSAVWTGSRMIVWGGINATRLNTGGQYDPVTDTWTPTSTGVNVPVGRNGHSAVWTGTDMIVWGGRSDITNVNTGGRYDPSSDTWRPTSIGAGVPSARVYPSAVWTGTRMLVWGGTYSKTGGRYDPSSDTWLPTSLNVPGGRFYNATVWTGTEMIVWGGTTPDISNSGNRYNPATDTWTRAAGWNVPQGRRLQTAVWTGAEMIVWGGYTGTVRNDGGRYSPATDTWTATSAGLNAPEAREEQSAVWTGTEMIVWGGWGSAPLSTGGRYNPITDSWAPTSTINAPTARVSHTAIWTGSSMIVWGGTDGPNFPQPGGRYDPASNSWLPTAVGPGTPSGRIYHTVVWTGTEMIVFGGGTSLISSVTGTGGRYNPSNDSWVATGPGTDEPSSRRVSHSAVWTGKEMIVWGGYRDPSLGEDLLDTGARYDPITDAWKATATGPNVPDARYEHNAAWTGEEMIVWGGLGGTISTIHYLNSGGRYDPATDTWRSTSVGANVPLKREYTSSVWTGNELIIWGGWDGNTYPNTAYRYCACTSGTRFYRDADADGHGDSGFPTSFCGGTIPAGYVADQSDCNDSDPQVWSGPGGVGHLLVSDSEPSGISWDSQDGTSGPGTVYDLVSGSLADGSGLDFASGTCLQSGGGVSYVDTRPNPDVGSGYWYLARAHNSCGVGTYGTPQRDAAIAACP